MEEETTVKEHRALIEESFSLRKNYDLLKRESERAWAKFQEVSFKAASVMENMSIDKMQTASGSFSYGYDESYKTPKTPEQKEAFYSYLRERGLFDQMISVNSRSLNSFCKAEEAVALQEGKILDFNIPGLEKGKAVLKPIMRKK